MSSELPCVGIVAARVADTHTGAWRAQRPIIDPALCVGCGICGDYCPVGCLAVSAANKSEVDLVYCKGCGICPSVCPKKAISMAPEV